jgi:hypothetical protein
MKTINYIYEFLKKYYKEIIIGFCVILLISKKYIDTSEIKKLEEIHQKEISDINQAREEENLEHEKNVKIYQSELEKINSQYSEAKKQLEQKQAARVNRIIEQTKSDPVELAKQLSNVTGIPIKE